MIDFSAAAFFGLIVVMFVTFLLVGRLAPAPARSEPLRTALIEPRIRGPKTLLLAKCYKLPGDAR